MGAEGEPEGLHDGPLYLDYNATTPVDPRVVEAMLPHLTASFGNPSSSHRFGTAPAAAVADARASVAALIGAKPDEVVFTGSGSEADATAIRGVVAAARGAGATAPHVVTQATEHPAVLAACRHVERHHGATITTLGVDVDGLVDVQALEVALTPATVLVSIMHANNETGAMQPIRQLTRVTRQHGAFFHTDAAQSVGKLDVDVGDLGIDLLTVVGHKMYAPKGIAALFVRDGVALEPLIGGGGQEAGRRAGTENVAGIVALGTAAELAAAELAAGSVQRLERLRDRLHDGLMERLSIRVDHNGPARARLPQTLNVSIRGVAGHKLLDRCGEALAASTGSACHAGRHEPSPVLTAMGLPPDRALSAVRLSLGRWTRESDVELAVEVISSAAGA